MDAVQLTPRGVPAVAEGAVPSALQPVLQVVEVRPITAKQTAAAANSSSERYRMVLSDGVHKQQAMLATACNHLVRDGTIRAGAIVQLVDFIFNAIHNRKIIIVMELKILLSECAIIGSPRPYEEPGPAVVQDPNLAPTAAQSNSGLYAGGPGMLGSSFAPRAEQASNNLSYGNGAQGMVGSSIGPTVEPGHGNVFTGASYGTMSEQNKVNENLLPPVSHQPSLNSYQDQRFAAPATVSPGNNYGCPEQPSYQHTTPVYINRRPAGRNESTPRIIPITALNKYQTTWTIRARVTAKANVRHWGNAKNGKVFSFDLLDAEGGEIRATCFNESVDQFYDLIEVGKVYLISGGKLKPANKKFNHLNHDLEITIYTPVSSIQICPDDYSIPRQQYNFRLISEIENMDNESMVDLLGVVTSVTPSVTIMKKNGTETQKRTLQIVDTSGRSVEVTFWGNFCDVEGQQLQLMCDSGRNPVLSLKGARVSDFGGRSVGTINSTQLIIDPDFPDAERLKQWYMTEGKAVACISLSQGTSNMGQNAVRKTIAQIKDENLGKSDMPDWVTIKASISYVHTESFIYPACPLMFNEKPCNKKATQNTDGMWHCGRCDKDFENCEYRYTVRFQIQDHTGTTYVTAFQEAGEQIFGRPAKDLWSIRNVNQDDALFTEITEGARWHLYIFKLKVKEESYNDERLVKSSIVKAEKLDPSKESHTLLRLIDNLLQDGLGSSPSVEATVAPHAGFTSVLTSTNAYTMNSCGANQFGQQGTIGNGMSTPQSGMARQQQSPGGNFTGVNYGSNAANAGSDVSFKGNQPGHWSSA